jgi:type II secretory pathway component PulJ
MRIAPTDSRGFTIVEALLAVSILGGLSITTMKLLEVQTGQRLNLSHAADSQTVLTSITSILADGDACSAAFAGATVGGEIAIKEPSDPTATFVAAGASFGKTGKITSVRVENVSPVGLFSATLSHEMLKLRIAGQSDAAGLGAGNFDSTYYFFAAVARPPDAPTIATCHVDHSLGRSCETLGGGWNPTPAASPDPLCDLDPPVCPALGLVLNGATGKCELADAAQAPPCDKDRELLAGYQLDPATKLLKPSCVAVDSSLLAGNCRAGGSTTSFLRGFDFATGAIICSP